MQPDPAPAVDLRLVPAALTAWSVTAAGIVWPVGAGLAVGCLAFGALWWLVSWRAPGGLLRAGGAGVISAAVVGAGFGFAVGLRNDAVREHTITHRFGGTSWVTVTPAESPRPLSNGRLMFRGDLDRLGDDATSGQVVVFASAAGFGELTAGRPVRFRARIGRPTRHDLTVATLTATGAPTLGTAGALQRAAQAVRIRFAARAVAVLPADQAVLLPALVLGDTSAIAPVTAAQFRTAGLTHLTAVSGANVTIVCGAVLLSARVFGPRSAVALAAVALTLFVIVVQPSASVLRAAVMGAIALLGLLSARRRRAIPALSAAVIALMIAAPQLAVDVGFALSVAATAALVVLAPQWSAGLVARGVPKMLADGVCIALAAQLVTAPLVAAVSGRLSVVGVIANLTVAVVIPPITVLGTAAAALCSFWPSAAGLLIRFTGPELWWLLRVAQTGAALPGAAVPVPSGWAGLMLVGGGSIAAIVLWRRRWFRMAGAGGLLGLLAWSISTALAGRP